MGADDTHHASEMWVQFIFRIRVLTDDAHENVWTHDTIDLKNYIQKFVNVDYHDNEGWIVVNANKV